jgi:hypothetical protein
LGTFLGHQTVRNRLQDHTLRFLIDVYTTG